MKSTLLPLLLLPSLAFAQARPSLLPAAPEPEPPAIAPVPVAPTPRTLQLSETIADWEARRDLARALSYIKRYDESLAEYRRVLDARPDDMVTRQEYGQVLLWAGRVDDARDVLSAVPQAQLTPAASLALGDTLVASRRYDEAEVIFRSQLAQDPSDQLTRLKIAEILSWTRRYDESLALYREILTALPDDVQVRRRYALVLLWSGKTEAAAAELRRTLPE